MKGLGSYIWRLDANTLKGDIPKVIGLAQEMGLARLNIKHYDASVNRSNLYTPNAPYLEALSQAARDANIQLWVWYWSYSNLQSPEAEAQTAARLAKEVGAFGISIDAESDRTYGKGWQWTEGDVQDEASKRSYAKKHVKALRDSFFGPIGFTSFRTPAFHPLPWKEALSVVDYNEPQLYYAGTNPDFDLRRSLKQHADMDLLGTPFIPLWPAYQEHGFKPTVDQIIRSLQLTEEHSFPAANFWALAWLAKEPLWKAAIAEHNPFKDETPNDPPLLDEVDFDPLNPKHRALIRGSAPIVIGDEDQAILTPLNEVRYGRLKHDFQVEVRDLDHGYDGDYPYPETRPLHTTPGGRSKIDVPISNELLVFQRDLQSTKEIALQMATIGQGIFNLKGNEIFNEEFGGTIPIYDLDKVPQPPLADSLSYGGNVVQILEERPAAVRVLTTYYKDPVSKLEGKNYNSSPELIVKPTSVDVKNGSVGLIFGRGAFTPVFSKSRDGLWIDKKWVEFFPSLPMKVRVRAPNGMNIRVSPPGADLTLSAKAGILKSREEVTITSCAVRGPQVWGFIPGRGWIALSYGSPPTFFTTWKMETAPPL